MMTQRLKIEFEGLVYLVTSVRRYEIKNTYEVAVLLLIKKLYPACWWKEHEGTMHVVSFVHYVCMWV